MNRSRRNRALNSPCIDSWIKIDHENRVHIQSGKVEIGQRVSTALTILVGKIRSKPRHIVIDSPDTTCR